MSKRFIDSGIFDDDWFMDLSKDAKILWIYFITKCDHAGILRLNEKLCKVQTDIKDLQTVIKQLGNRLVNVNEHLYFIPKFIEFQYPGFPNSKVRQQQSALEILIKLNLYNDGKLTVNELLGNSYDNGNVIGNDSGSGNVRAEKIYFDDAELNSLFIDFLEMRKKIKKPATERAIELLLKDLEKIKDKKGAIEQSIKKNYQGLFEPKVSIDEPEKIIPVFRPYPKK